MEYPDRFCEPLWKTKRRPAGLAVWILRAVLLGAVIGMTLGAMRAYAEPVEFDCASLATGIDLMVDFRDSGADVDKVVKIARQRNSDATPAHRAVIEREIRKLWKEGRQRRDAVLEVYKRCRAQMGDMGRES